MSTNPYNAMFDVQQTMIENSWTAVQGAVTMQRSAAQAALEGAEAAQSVQAAGVDVSKRAVSAYLDALVSVGVPPETVEEFHGFVDEQYAAYDELTADVWTAFEDTLVAYEDLTDTQLDALEDAFDAVRDANRQAADVAADVDVVDPDEN